MEELQLSDRIIIDVTGGKEKLVTSDESLAKILNHIASAVRSGHVAGTMHAHNSDSELVKIKWVREYALPECGIKHHILKHDTYELMQQWKSNVYDQHTDKDMPKKSGPAMLNEAAAIIDAVKMEDHL